MTDRQTTNGWATANSEHEREFTFAKKLNDKLLAWLSVWSEVQIICIWSS